MSSDRPDAAADRQRHEAHFRRSPDDVEQDAAILVARGDVEKAEFVRPGPVVGDSALDRIAGVAQIDEIDALDDATVLDVEAGDDPGLQRHGRRPSVSCARSAFGLQERQRLPRIEASIVERAAGDRAGETGAVGRGQAA